MRRSTTTTHALSSAVAVLALTGCAGQAEPADTSPASSAPARRGDSAPSAPVPLSSAQLSQRLLAESDLGEGYIRKPEAPRRHDDVTVIGCPKLEKLGSDAATGSGLAFTSKAKVSFTYTGTSNSLATSRIRESRIPQELTDHGHREWSPGA